MLVGGKHLAPVSIFVHGSLCHEDGVVIALAEDEGGEDDVHDVELHVEDGHQSQYPQPTDSHRDEREDC